MTETMPERILIVDDDPQVVRLFAYILTHAGYVVDTALSGQAALQQVRQARPALILLDIMMPEMDGYEVTRQLRAAPETTAIPIVMLTARAVIADKVVGLQSGATAYLVKPVRPTVLLETVREVLARSAPDRPPLDALRQPR
jgi:DNA-binding response OmpR family regulator